MTRSDDTPLVHIPLLIVYLKLSPFGNLSELAVFTSREVVHAVTLRRNEADTNRQTQHQDDEGRFRHFGYSSSVCVKSNFFF